MRSNSLQKKVFLPFPNWEGVGGWVKNISTRNKMQLSYFNTNLPRLFCGINPVLHSRQRRTGFDMFPYDDSQSNGKSVLVIGAAGLDIVGRTTEMLELQTSTPAKVRPSFGGVARNIAENLAHLGEDVHLITAVGQDQFGWQLLEHADSAGINIDDCLASNKYATSSYLAVLTEKGLLSFALYDMRVLEAITPNHIRDRAHLFKEASLVFVDANLCPATLRTIFHQARLAKIPVCADAASHKVAPRLLPYLDKLLMLTANAHEASFLTNTEFQIADRDAAQLAARNLINLGVQAAFIPIAEFGVCYATPQTSGHIPAMRTRIADPTGAGDALTATLIYGYLNDIPLEEALRLGVSAASLTLRHPGTVVPDLSLEKIYDQLVI
jgi:pseudouridine kinase